MNQKMDGMESKHRLYECHYNPTGFERRSTKHTKMQIQFEVPMENVKFQFNMFFRQLVEQYYENLF